MPHYTRREFVAATAAATASLTLPISVRPLARDLRVGVIGCGGRGTGAIHDCLTGTQGTVIVALGDLLPDHLAECRTQLANMAKEEPALAPRIRVEDAKCFTGFDAYQKVIAAGVDLVILATPPGFRPLHLAAAVAAGKHVFMEKPVAVDPAGVRSVIASAEVAARRGLALVAGTQRRHDVGYRATMEKLHAGAIGEITSGRVYWNQGGLWMHPRKAEWTDVEWQLRNWLYFTWLSGDHIVEQHIHNLDVANWALDAHPVKATGLGGRQWRTDPAFGHVFDHFAIDYEYPNGAHITSMCRQIDGTAPYVGEFFQGTKGKSDGRSMIEGAEPWRFDPQVQKPNPYVQEHADLVASIVAGQPLNEGKRVAESTLTAIMGREAAYTGQVITWDELLNCDLELMPPTVAFGPMPVPPVAMPGTTTIHRSWRVS